MNKMINLLEKRRTFVGAAVKAIDSKARTIRAYASTNAWDRYGERFEADAFKDGLENYKKNPVILFAHDYSQAPIARAIAYEIDAKGLILTMEFADTALAKEIFSLYEGGFMSAFSVGFRPLEWRFEERVAGSGETGVVFVKAELLENSAVPVPANPEAVVMKGIGGQTKQLSGEILGHFMEQPYRSHGADAVLIPGAVPVPADAAALAPALRYLLDLGKTVRGGKVSDEAVRSLLIQANNLFRELVYGPSAAPLEEPAGALSDAEIDAMVREVTVLAGQVKTEDDKKGLARAVTLLHEAISGE